VAPDETLCTVLIKAYGRNKQADKALDVLRMMEEANLRPDITSMNTAMAVCGWRNRLDDARRLFYQELPRLGLSPDLVTYNIFLNIHARRGLWPEALSTFEQMKASKIKPDVVSYTGMVKVSGGNCKKDR